MALLHEEEDNHNQELIIGEKCIQHSIEPLQMIQLNLKGFPL